MDIAQLFTERLQEIDAYLSLLDALERELQSGPPVIGGTQITVQQQKILNSSVYLQLYNLVEATVTWCMEAVTTASSDGAKWTPADLDDQLRREWIKISARTHVDLAPGTRLDTAFDFCTYIMQGKPVEKWDMGRAGGGNWDVHAIQELTERIGCNMRLTTPTYKAVKRFIRDDMGAIELVKHLRNQLAHGAISFEDCGDGVTVSDLKSLRITTGSYLAEVVGAFTSFIANHEFIVQQKRPAPPGGGS